MVIARIFLGVEQTNNLSVPATVLNYEPVRHDLLDQWHEDPEIAERLDALKSDDVAQARKLH